MDETERRRKVQRQYNEDHGITPETITRAILDVMHQSGERDYYAVPALRAGGAAGAKGDKKNSRAATAANPESEWVERIQALRQEMFLAAENLEFEKAARLRDELRKLQADASPTVAAATALSDSRAPRGGRAVGRGTIPGGKKRARKTRAN
jgi:excinuclease ABC subunit B